MKLSEVLNGIKFDTIKNGFNKELNLDLDINDVTTDPNLCAPGVLYLAVESETVDSTRYGVRLDGRDFIEEAIANGASAILSDKRIEQKFENKSNPPLIITDNPLSHLGLICSRVFGEARPGTLALVTGTNGKTSTVNFTRQIWTELGFQSCSVGNLGGVCSDGSLVWPRDPVLSVPETVFMHKMLVNLAKRKINHVAMEATSHALFDYRLHNSQANIGAFCNLTRDHLDFHLTMQEYFRVKMLLFTEVLNSGSAAILNADSDYFDQAYQICKSRQHQIFTYGINGKEIKLLNSVQTNNGQILNLSVLGKNYEVPFNLFGEFQVSNAICALAIAIASRMTPDLALASLEKLTEVEGRLNHVATMDSGGKIIVDFAHTPDGIRAALMACRSFTRGKLIIVFGSAGDRDQGKRPLMGEMASSLADLVIITDDSPGFEDPSLIRKEILSGAKNAVEIADRLEAIRYAAAKLSGEDTLLLAGLGHETSITKGENTIPFSDLIAAKQITAERHL